MAVTLADQVGAMGIVDRLRFQSHRVQDYLNTAQQKKQLIEKIAAGYAAEGTEVHGRLFRRVLSSGIATV